MTTNTAKREVYAELLAASEKRIADLESEISVEKCLVRRCRVALLHNNGKPVESSPKRITPGSTVPGTLPEKIVDVLRENGAPMRAAEINRVLEGRGVTTTAKKGLLPNVLSALSRKKDLFRKVAHGTYDLIQETTKPADESAGS